MATNTPKLTLPKPDANDNFNRAAYNALIDAIDNNVGTKTQAAETHAADSVKHVTAEDKAAWSAKASTAVATQSANGLMSAADKLALDNAQKWKLTQDNGDALAPVADANLITKSGYYRTSGTTINTPNNAINGVIMHIDRDGRPNQLYFRYEDQTFYIRYKQSPGWLPWRRIVDTNLLGNLILGNKLVDQSLANFIGKAVDSTIFNPHYAGSRLTVGLGTPSQSWLEFIQSNYNSLMAIDGAMITHTTSVNGEQAQQRFSFNLIEHFQRTYGTIPGAATADKVAWLKSNLSKLTFNWWGFGANSVGNRSTITRWGVTTSAWDTGVNHVSGYANKLSLSINNPTLGAYIDTNGFIHFIAYAEPSNGTTPSVINTDYAELEVELSTGIWNNTPAFTWINATYQNSWASFDADRALKYAKDEKGTVTLRGTIKSGTVGTATPVMTLPAGFRPLESSLSIPITVSGGIGELQIQSSGAVSIASASYGASPNPSTQAHIYVRFFAGQ